MRLLLATPFLLLLVLFALSNTEPVALGLWPTDLGFRLPLSLAVLGAMAIAFLAGGLLVWSEALRQRRRAKRAEASARLLETRLLNAAPTTPLILPAEPSGE
ncbi:MAG: LapA family protein [Rhodospirillales bacterium]|nr:LapA family protein [Rhodospirillales bacterium]